MGHTKVAVIGAGIGGLAAAIRLAAAGCQVTVYEKNSRPGGKISEFGNNGHRFDTGPSLFTLPYLVEELFEMCGEKMEESVPYRPLEINCRYYFENAKPFTFYHNPEKLRAEIKNAGMKNGEAVFRRLDHARELYELSAPVFLFSNFHKLTNFNTPPYKNIARKLYKLDFLRSMHRANRRDFDDERLVQIFDRYATYNGSNPYHAPATLNMIAHLENNIGAFFPDKGMYSIVQGLYDLAVRQGIEFRFDTTVTRITVENGKATAVETDTEKIAFQRIVSDVDVKYLSRHILKNHPLKKRLENNRPSSSALIFYWKINRMFPELDLHNILFAENYKREFDAIFKEGTVADDNSIYIFISSKVVPGDAPAGCENWFVMINVPSDSDQPWSELVAQTRNNIISKIDRVLNTSLRNHIIGEQVATPLTIESNTSSAGGALYGAASNSPFSAFLRHPNCLKSIANLYFVGGSVHPGGGIPLCLASASIVCEEITTVT